MKETNPEHGAFACAADEKHQAGLTKREYFAALIYQGISTISDSIANRVRSAAIAVECADALIEELNKASEK
jgi:hypothetical protein